MTTVYTSAPYHRTPEDVVAALVREADRPDPPARPRPIAEGVRAARDGKDVALTRRAQRAAQRVALTDGAAALQQRMAAHLPGYTLVLDVTHAAGYLWDAANALLGARHPARPAWMRRPLTRVLSGQTAAVIAALEAAAADPARTATPRQALPRAGGWPVGTGVVEGACGHPGKDRMQRAGMRWTQAGAQTVLALRAVRLNGDGDADWRLHRQQPHRRPYGMTLPPPAPVEDQALKLAA